MSIVVPDGSSNSITGGSTAGTGDFLWRLNLNTVFTLILHLPHLLPLPFFPLFVSEGCGLLIERVGLGGLTVTAGGADAGAAYCRGIDGMGGASRLGIGGRAVAFRSGTERAEKVVCDVSGRTGDS